MNSQIPVVDEAARIFTICNACRYCEGHCAVFPAMMRRSAFDSDTVSYLANLCHGCGACLSHCQYAPPHEFNVNLPATMAEARHASLNRYAGVSQGPIGALTITVLTSLLLATGMFGYAGSEMFNPTTAGFYHLMPHNIMAALFSMAALLVVASWWRSIRRAWREFGLPSPGSIPVNAWTTALHDGLKLTNLGGGHGEGCYTLDDRASLLKRRLHHLTLSGFLLCFAATCLGTLYHYLLDQPAPYDWTSPPKVTGTAGGILLLIGSTGLLWMNHMTPKNRTHKAHFDVTLTMLLMTTAATGLLLPLLAGTTVLGSMLALHLGVVLALFVNFAQGKFLHGWLRLLALLTDVMESRTRP